MNAEKLAKASAGFSVSMSPLLKSQSNRWLLHSGEMVLSPGDEGAVLSQVLGT